MKLGEFHTLVSSSLKRGAVFDDQIPQQVQLAAQWLERNYTMKYMEKFRLLQVAVGDRIIQMPANVMIKSVRYIRLIGEDGLYNYLTPVNMQDLKSLRGGTYSNDAVPYKYSLIGLDTLVLDAIPAAVHNGEAIFHEYSDWPTGPNSSHPLLKIASDVLLPQTLWYMSVFLLKDLRMAEAYKATRDEAVNTLTRADDELTYGGGDSGSMEYSPYRAG